VAPVQPSRYRLIGTKSFRFVATEVQRHRGSGDDLFVLYGWQNPRGKPCDRTRADCETYVLLSHVEREQAVATSNQSAWSAATALSL